MIEYPVLLRWVRDGLAEKTAFKRRQVVKLAEAAVEENSLRGVAAFISNLYKTWWHDGTT